MTLGQAPANLFLSERPDTDSKNEEYEALCWGEVENFGELLIVHRHYAVRSPTLTRCVKVHVLHREPCV